MRASTAIRLSLLASLAIACSDDTGDDELGETSSSSSSGSESGSESGTSESSSESEATSSADTSSETSADTSSETSVDTSSETGSETGDPSCEDDQWLGAGIADDGWTLGSLCDEIWVCAAADQVAALEALDPQVVCEPGNTCPDQHCTLSWQIIVDQATLDRVCEALLLPGIDAAYCLVLGP